MISSAIGPPSDLRFSRVEPTSFTVHWTAPGQENRINSLSGLTGYRVVVNPKTKSGPTKEVSLAPDSTQAYITGLMVSVYAHPGTNRTVLKEKNLFLCRNPSKIHKNFLYFVRSRRRTRSTFTP